MKFLITFYVCFLIFGQAINSARKEKMSQKCLIIDLQENQHLWETKYMQHCVVVEFCDDTTANQYRKRPTRVHAI